jgi:prepilin-type N-terminal cleavage/methylation domain-containing protein
MNNTYTRRRDRRRGFSLIELLIVVAIILVLVGAGLPKLNQYLMNTREVAAIQQIKNLQTAEQQYMSQFGRFATSLEELGPNSSGQQGPEGADLIAEDMVSGEKGGYRYTLQEAQGGYSITAAPVSFGSTGRRTFYSDHTLVIRENWGEEMATPASPQIQ